MSEPERPRLVFLGLPRTGKSTFLGALWALIQSPVERSLRESDFSGDRSYVQRLAEQVARGEELDRTALDADEELAVEVAFDPEGIAELRIPDTSGEALRVLAERRIWYPRLLAACTDATAILIFVHPERLRLPQRIAVAVAGAGVETEADERAPGEIEFHPPDGVRFQAQEHECTAAELIDVFENLAELWSERPPVRVGVVVSAWDRVEGEPKPTPHEWMAARLPGVLSTLESNRDVAEFAVFGVSAQGGRLEDRGALLAKGEICDRVFASDRNGRAVSLAEPIRWAIWGP
jgi:double-GTPase-like protein